MYTTSTTATKPGFAKPFPSRSPMHYCMTCPACTAVRAALAQLEGQPVAQIDRDLAAEYAAEDLDCHCSHTVTGCEFFNADEHDDLDCGTCNYVDEDTWCER